MSISVKPCRKNVIYLDNNGTTKLCKESVKAMNEWLESRSNPSTSSILGIKSKEMIDNARNYIKNHCGDKDCKVIFTSGASESNCLIIRSIVDKCNKIPVIITSAIEHKSILSLCESLQKEKRIKLVVVKPDKYGHISPTDVEKAIKENKCVKLVSIMAANNEIGTINNIKEIGRISHKHGIPFHTDAVQIFGKYHMNMKKNNIDALSMSFHKLQGPMGIGMLVIGKDIDLKSQISGTQQYSMRGGTENVPAIAGAVASIKKTFTNRDRKNNKLMKLREHLIKQLSENDIKFILLGSPNNPLPNTVCISLQYDNFCNVKLKNYLNKKGIIVSIGSACNTKSKKASHVLNAIKASKKIKRGVMRISMGDDSKKSDLDTFVKELKCHIRQNYS